MLNTNHIALVITAANGSQSEVRFDTMQDLRRYLVQTYDDREASGLTPAEMGLKHLGQLKAMISYTVHTASMLQQDLRREGLLASKLREPATLPD